MIFDGQNIILSEKFDGDQIEAILRGLFYSINKSLNQWQIC